MRGAAKTVLCEAMLKVAGRSGFRDTHVQAVTSEAALPLASFYEHFHNLEHCFMVAYERKAHQLCEAILSAGRDGADWPEGLRRSLRVLLEFVAEQPLTATALIVEGGAPGSLTGPIHTSVLKRLARALESARRQPGARHSAPLLTADLMVGAINNTLQGLLVKGESAKAPTLLGDYTYLVMLAFFDEEVAYREMDSAERES